MRWAMTGAGGFIGSALQGALRAGGHDILRLVRTDPRGDDGVRWDPTADSIDTSALTGVDGVIHLAGESIAAGRWTDRRKALIESSRVDGTALIARTVAALEPRPKVLLCASAIGIYGDRGDEELDESSARGSGFLADVVSAWEAAADPARTAGIRVVHARSGIVLDRGGGALAKMLTPFRLGAGGRLGSGEQYMSWISLADTVRALVWILQDESLSGPVNVVGPAPVQNIAFTRALGAALRRPTIIPMPSFAVRAAFGQMGEELLLYSARVKPTALERTGFSFEHPSLKAALAATLNGNRK